MELLAVVTILGIIAAIIVPRVAVSSDTAKSESQRAQQGDDQRGCRALVCGKRHLARQ